MSGANPTSAAGGDPAASSPGMRAATGRDRVEWFALLDAWGGATRPYGDITDWLSGEHGLSPWWSQKLAVEYEQARGTREPGARRDGTFSVTASKAVAAPVERLYEAVTEPTLRATWLPGLTLRERTARVARSARFDCVDDDTRVNITFTAKGPARSEVAVEHARLPDAQTAATAKRRWRERLNALKALLER
jgi:hypothetical protein